MFYFILGLLFLALGLAMHNGFFIGLGVIILLAAAASTARSAPRYRTLTGVPQCHLIKCDEFFCPKCGTTWHRREVGIPIPACETCGGPRVRGD